MLFIATLLLDVVTFNPSLVYNVLSVILVLLTGAGFIFNLKTQIQLLRNDLQNLRDNVSKLEQKTSADYTKIENKMGLLEEKIEQLPVNITNLIKTFLKN